MQDIPGGIGGVDVILNTKYCLTIISAVRDNHLYWGPGVSIINYMSIHDTFCTQMSIGSSLKHQNVEELGKHWQNVWTSEVRRSSC